MSRLRQQQKALKKRIDALIKKSLTQELKLELNSPNFYGLSRRVIFRFIHRCSNSFDAEFRNEMTDFFLSNELYLSFARKNVRNFPL